jgi:NAD(P)-dependent dehydrogenase (short-subunit alcohol dehydrogenase family)
MSGRFHDRVVIVTGGSKGIGAGCAEVFCAEGAKVAILDIDEKSGRALSESLTCRGPGTATYLDCDVRDPNCIQAAIVATVQRFGQLDCIINNAGIHPPATKIEDVSIEEMESILRVNYISTFAGAKYAVPYLRQTRGTILIISSMTAVLGQTHSAAYAASKAAQLGLTKALALELAEFGIRVNAVLPSNVDTPLMRAWAATLADPASALASIAALQVLGRMARPEEIGRVCLFLATEDASFITGQGIHVDGGASLDY